MGLHFYPVNLGSPHFSFIFSSNYWPCGCNFRVNGCLCRNSTLLLSFLMTTKQIKSESVRTCFPLTRLRDGLFPPISAKTQHPEVNPTHHTQPPRHPLVLVTMTPARPPEQERGLNLHPLCLHSLHSFPKTAAQGLLELGCL